MSVCNSEFSLDVKMKVNMRQRYLCLLLSANGLHRGLMCCHIPQIESIICGQSVKYANIFLWQPDHPCLISSAELFYLRRSSVRMNGRFRATALTLMTRPFDEATTKRQLLSPANLRWEHCRYWLEQLDRNNKRWSVLERGRQAAVNFESSSERSAVDWRPLQVRRGRAFRGIRPGPACINHSFPFSLITHESTSEIETVIWFMRKWKLTIGGDGAWLRGSPLRPMTFQIVFKQSYHRCGCHSVWLTDCWELLDCLAALMTDWDCAPLCLTLQQCLIS